jgi:hypothetical protein
MMKSTTLILTLAASAIAIGCAVTQSGTPARAAAPPSTRGQCFRVQDVNGYSPVSDNVVDVQAGASRYFRLSLDGWCPQSAFSRRVALKTSSGSSWICQGYDAEIVVPSSSGAERCLINNVQPISKADWLTDRRH